MVWNERLPGRWGMLLVLFLVGTMAFSQEPKPREIPLRTAAPSKEQVGTVELGTGESLTFIGRKLWFEMRKRLNLTTEAEEKAQREAERDQRLRLGSIRVEP